jgi:hypothetical protein
MCQAYASTPMWHRQGAKLDSGVLLQQLDSDRPSVETNQTYI